MKVAKSIFVLILLNFLNFKHVKLDSCITQENTIGNCVQLNDCQILQNLLPKARKNAQIREYLLKSQCTVSSRPPFVCCPANNIKLKFDEPDVEIKLPKASEGICGRSYFGVISTPSRIVGGEEASLGEFPFVALLVYLKPGNRLDFNCGGTIITSRHVLSAAHCTSPTSIPSSWRLTKVRVGEFNTETIVDCEEINSVYTCGFPPQDIDIESVIVHNQYSSYQPGNPHDIAIVKLKETIEFNEFVKPICLPLNNEVSSYYGSSTVIGFGQTENSRISTILKKAEIDIIENRICALKYQAHSRTIHSNQICAARVDNDACSGDSGGGLLKQADNSMVWYLIGVVSYGPKLCAKDYPGVYVNVKDYITWIRNKIEERN